MEVRDNMGDNGFKKRLQAKLGPLYYTKLKDWPGSRPRKTPVPTRL